MTDLIQTLQQMNQAFGHGSIESITFNMNESRPPLDEWYGTVKVFGDDGRMFKIVDGFVTFLSRRRKVCK